MAFDAEISAFDFTLRGVLDGRVLGGVSGRVPAPCCADASARLSTRGGHYSVRVGGVAPPHPEPLRLSAGRIARAVLRFGAISVFWADDKSIEVPAGAIRSQSFFADAAEYRLRDGGRLILSGGPADISRLDLLSEALLLPRG